jgi:hypothetical protein
MSVRNRSKWDYEYRTFCDFGTPGRRDVIANHFSLAAAQKAFKRWKKWYSYEGNISGRHLYRCWQEKRYTNEIINDTGSPWEITARSSSKLATQST